MAGILGFRSLAPKTKNVIVAGGLTSFVFGVYFYTMRAVGGTDELQVAIDKFEEEKGQKEAEASLPSTSEGVRDTLVDPTINECKLLPPERYHPDQIFEVQTRGALGLG